MENYSCNTAHYGSGIADCTYCEYLDDFRVTVHGHDGVKKWNSRNCQRDGKQKSSIKKVFPGYVLVKMIMTDETWYVVKNIKGVFNFVGVGDKPLPLTEKDMQSLGIEDIINLDFEVGDNVRITTEPFYNYPAVIEEIFKDKKRVKVKVSMFGRETTVDLEFNQIQKI